MKCISTLFLSFLLLSFAIDTQAATYTAIANGNYSTGGTWTGGIAPPTTLVGDNVVIPNGITVTTVADIAVTGISAGMTVNGTLSGVNNNLDAILDNLTGTGTIDIDSFSGTASVAGAYVFGGTVNAKKTLISFTTVMNNTTIHVSEKLYLSGKMTMTKGQLNMDNNTAIVVTGMATTPPPASLSSIAPATISYGNPYTVTYINGSANTGAELFGTGLSSIEVNVGTGEEVRAHQDFNLTATTLKLTEGALNLNNHNLTVGGTGDVQITNGMFKSSASTDMTFNKTVSSALAFAMGSSVGKLTQNAANLKLDTDVKIGNELHLQAGKLDVQTNILSLITGATITNAAANRYVITGAGGGLSTDVPANTTVTYHVGTATSYAPCAVTANNNTVYNGLKVGVEGIVRAVGQTGTIISATQPLVSATWYMSQNGSATIDADITAMWTAGMEVNNFDRQQAYISLLNGAVWDMYKDTTATENNGMYSITRRGVSFFAPMTVFDINTVDVQEVATDDGINIYPNPAHDVLHITTQQATPVQVYIYNTAGRLVQSANLLQGDNAIQVSSLQTGVYYLQILGEQQVVKFVKM